LTANLLRPCAKFRANFHSERDIAVEPVTKILSFKG